MDTIPLSEAKARLSEVTDLVWRTHQRITVTRNGVPALVMIAPEDLEGLEATIELLSDPDARGRIAAAEDELARGEGLAEDAVRALLARRRDA
jgi:prevent-host-death family protein